MADREVSLASNIELCSLNLVEVGFMRGGGDFQDVQTKVSTQGQLSCDVDRNFLAYKTRFDFRITNEDADGDLIAEGHLVFEVVYQVLNEYEPVDEETQEFGLGSVVFQAHPYLRETFATLCSRSGLPGYVLPVLRARTNVALESAERGE